MIRSNRPPAFVTRELIEEWIQHNCPMEFTSMERIDREIISIPTADKKDRLYSYEDTFRQSINKVEWGDPISLLVNKIKRFFKKGNK